MKKLIFCLSTAIIFLGVVSCTETERNVKIICLEHARGVCADREDTLRAMFHAFASVESNNKSHAVSPCGKYVGCLQISEIMLQEANRILGFECFFAKDGWDDRLDEHGSYAIFRTVMLHHNKALDIERACEVWNPRCKREYRMAVRCEFEKNINEIKQV